MLNKDGARELAYLVHIDAIEPIVGSDNCEAAVVGGWRVMVRKNTFSADDPAIYFEIDSKVDPENPAFGFLAGKHYAVKTQRYKFGGAGNFLSQGLLMHPLDFDWEIIDKNTIKSLTGEHKIDDESRFLTKELKVTYYIPEDNSRKSSYDKYKAMAQRCGKLFAHQPFRWLMHRDWGKKLLFIFFGKKKDKRTDWPVWVSRTDEERIQNLPFLLEDKAPWIVTEKVDGSSTTFTLHKEKFGKKKYLVCSRNVVFDSPKKNEKLFYDSNIYLEMSEKYHIEEALNKILENDFPEAEWVTLQGETYGEKVQNRDYHLKGHDFKGFNLVISTKGRLNSIESRDIMAKYGIPWVPILRDDYILPDTIDEVLTYAEGISEVDGDPREGLVFRSLDGVKSFKAVSNSYLLKYHG